MPALFFGAVRRSGGPGRSPRHRVCHLDDKLFVIFGVFPLFSVFAAGDVAACAWLLRVRARVSRARARWSWALSPPPAASFLFLDFGVIPGFRRPPAMRGRAVEIGG